MANVKSVAETSQAKTTTPTTSKVKKKTYKSTDEIVCTSVTSGRLLMPGAKSGIVYRWLDAGDSTGIEYQDLVAAIRTRSSYIYAPRFVIEDFEFLSQYEDVQKIYENLYSKDDLKSILTLSADNMKRVIEQLPDGVKDSVKSMAMSAIDSGELDSIQAVKVIDEIFGTQMLVKLTA